MLDNIIIPTKSEKLRVNTPNPQKEDGFVPIANEIAEQLCLLNLTPYEWRILWAIFRKTYGWQKKSDHISYSQFARMTAISNSNVARTLKSLINKNIIKADKSGYVVEYQFQKNYTLWVKPLSHQIVSHEIVSHEIETTLLPDSETTLSPDSNNRQLKQYTKTSKTTNKKLSFNDFIEEIKKDKRYQGLDIEYQLKKWEEYWSEGSRKLKKPKTAFRNWLEKALEYKSNTGSSPKTFKGNGNKPNTANELSDENSKMLEELDRR